MVVYLAGEDLTADDLNPLFVRKTIDESIPSSTALQNDDHLFLPYEANRTYIVESHFIHNSIAAADFKFDYTTGAGVSGWWTATNPTLGSAASAPYLGALLWGSGGTFEGFGVDMYARISGLLVVGGTPGTLQFRFAQNTSNATPAIVRINSWLRLTPVL